MPAKILIIGLDGADRDLLQQWSQCGDLPTLQSLKRQGVCGEMTSPPGLGDDATWASLYTGVSPGRHGRYFYRQVWPGTYEVTNFVDADLKREPFWETLSRVGRRVAIIDVPKCPVSKNLNGIQLNDWLVHGRDHSQVCSWPPHLAAEVIARFGPAPPSLCQVFGLGQAEYQTFLTRLLASVEMKLQLSMSYLERGDWDLFMTVFKESHCVGHRCWHFLDPSHPQYDAVQAGSLANPIKIVYTAIDAAVSKLLERVGPETTVIVFSNLGMGPNYYCAEPLLDEILLRLEGAHATPMTKMLAFLKLLWRKVPAGIRQRINRHNGRMNGILRESQYSHRKCFVMPHNECSGAIRVNLVGRESHGRVHPGAEYNAFCDTLIQDLLDLVNPDTGDPLVQEVLRTADLYHGEYVADLPDLIVIWRREAPISGARSPKVGEIRHAYPEHRSGNHMPNGFFYASGPGIEPGVLTAPGSVMDLAPTIATLLQVPLPEVEGVPIAAVCGEKHSSFRLL